MYKCTSVQVYKWFEVVALLCCSLSVCRFSLRLKNKNSLTLAEIDYFWEVKEVKKLAAMRLGKLKTIQFSNNKFDKSVSNRLYRLGVSNGEPKSSLLRP